MNTVKSAGESNIFSDWINGGYADWNQKQLLSLIVVVLICLIFSLYVFIKIKKYAKEDKAPSGIILAMEGYVNYIDNVYDDNTDRKIPKARFYVFGLATFLLLGNLLGLIGLEPVTTSYSIALTFGLMSWLGIYVTGLIYQKWRFFARYKNPIEIIGQFSPLISISFRIFGNIIGGSIIMVMIYSLFGYIWTKMIPNSPPLPLLAVIFTPVLHLYFDVFSAFIQALVFCSLTTIWWAQEAEIEEKNVKIDEKSNYFSSNQIKVKQLNVAQNIY
ncbi:F0F1 ATP synthase subunit A [Mycoplasmopsis bovis]|uniref:ATP synthase F0 subunit A n=3 Tax=Mycoplasmopsis bovis TaxID=28903 RepID=A0A2N8U2F2_MYCBV|nr:F0F1 ATP synthase subunit A [Mycoplasmopsis bovis]ADR25031.1 ATP synthase F0, A subunit [Mycoplasmopsis bovis PG45]AEI90130.1 F0F1 ATP synthase subunit A [Mycoplasmopsis bovis Hubei-1]AFM51801.1 ATPase subunit a [Mycoplasmopsis bovis HB0801]AIA33993.1 F0F1 ATP synthase subunit A [Mycoplasmopsis bovis CQ-W70]AKO50612.1 ATP synthase F0F1 subunit A [Mycoplasmopsis bovis]